MKPRQRIMRPVFTALHRPDNKKGGIAAFLVLVATLALTGSLLFAIIAAAAVYAFSVATMNHRLAVRLLVQEFPRQLFRLKSRERDTYDEGKHDRWEVRIK